MDFPRRELLATEWSRLRATLDEHPAWWRTSSTFLAFFLLAVTFQAMFQLLQTVIALPRPGATRRPRLRPVVPDDAALAPIPTPIDLATRMGGDAAPRSGARLLPVPFAVAGSLLLSLSHAAYWTLQLWVAATVADSTAQAALLLALAAVPSVAVAVAGRSLADRADTRLAVFGLRLLVAAALGTLAVLAARNALTVPAFAGITLSLGITWSLQRPAPLGGSAVAIAAPVGLAAMIAPLGIVLLAANTSLASAFGILAVVELIGALAVLSARRPTVATVAEPAPEARAGRSLVVLALIPSTLGGGMLVFLPAIAMDRLDVGLAGFGALASALGAGFVAGLVAAAGRAWLRPRVVAGVALAAVALVGLVYVLSPVAAAALLALYGLGAGLATGAVLCSPRTSAGQRARAAGLAGPLTSMSPLATLVAAGLAAQFSVVVAAWLFAITVAAVAGMVAVAGGIAWLMGYEEVAIPE